MTKSTRSNLYQAGRNAFCLKTLHKQIMDLRDSYDHAVPDVLSSIVSALYLDTKIRDMKNNREGKIEVRDTTLLFSFKDTGNEYKTYVISDFSYGKTHDFLSNMPGDDLDNFDIIAEQCSAYLRKALAPIFDRYQVVVEYSSVWTGEGTITSDATVNMGTNEVTVNQVYDPSDILDEDGNAFECNTLEDEYIEFADRTKKPCHNRYTVDEYDKSEWNPDKDFWYN